MLKDRVESGKWRDKRGEGIAPAHMGLAWKQISLFLQPQGQHGAFL